MTGVDGPQHVQASVTMLGTDGGLDQHRVAERNEVSHSTFGAEAL